MKIKSITDVITNSSSEVFIINPQGKKANDILEDLIKVNAEFLESGEDIYSGDCQDIELDGYARIHKKVKFPRFLMDRGFTGTIKYIKENYVIHNIEHWG